VSNDSSISSIPAPLHSVQETVTEESYARDYARFLNSEAGEGTFPFSGRILPNFLDVNSYRKGAGSVSSNPPRRT